MRQRFPPRLVTCVAVAVRLIICHWRWHCWHSVAATADHPLHGMRGEMYLPTALLDSFSYWIKHASQPLPQWQILDLMMENDWKLCMSRVNSHEKFRTTCPSERISIQCKTMQMHQACLHGCQQVCVASTMLGCHGMKCLGKLEDWPMFIVPNTKQLTQRMFLPHAASIIQWGQWTGIAWYSLLWCIWWMQIFSWCCSN